MTTVLFYPGGPGLNGNGERELLTASYRAAGLDLVAWDEPSSLRPDPSEPAAERANAFERYLLSAERSFTRLSANGPLGVMAHSFGAFAACHVASRHPGAIRALVFVSTALSSPHADRNMLGIAARDFEAAGDPRAAVIRQTLASYSGRFDERTEIGFRAVVEDERLFDAYWHDKDAMARFLACYAPPRFGLDLEGFFQVRRAGPHLPHGPIDVPATLILGRRDVIVSGEAETALLRGLFPRLTIHVLEESAHYPHVEEPDLVLSIVSSTLGPLG